MEIVEILKKPFTDIGKLVVGTVLGVIPIVHFVVLGFGIDNFKKPKEIPNFSVDQFILGVKAFLLGVLYSLVPFTLAVIGLYLDYTALMAFGLVLALSLLPAITRAILEMSKKNSFKDGLNFNKIFSETYTKKFLVPWLISTLLSVVVGSLLELVPEVGWMVSTYVSTVIFWTCLGARIKI